MRTRSLAIAAATILWLGLAAAPAPAAPRDDPDPGRLQQSVTAVRDLLHKAGDRMRPGEEVTPPPAGADAIRAETAGQPPAAVLTDGAAPPLYRDRELNCEVPAFAESRFAGFDTQVTTMMKDWGFMTASLAVANECGTIYDQGYGRVGPWWARNAPPGKVTDLGPVTPDNELFRIASITKPLTAAAIHDLDERGLLEKTDYVFCVKGGPANCILTVDLPAGFDERIADLRVKDLVGHRGGFDNNKTTDYLFRAWEVYQARKLNAPPTPRDFTEFMLGLGLDAAPGAEYHYSNLGYLILGMVIEQAGKLPYRDYVYQRLLAPLGIASGDVVLSRTKRLTRNTREPAYWCVDKNWNANVPISTFAGEAGKRRCYADGGWVLESMAAHGGLSMSASAVATFYAHWWNFGTPRTAETYWNFPAGTKIAYSHNGRLAATQTVAARCVNGLNVVLLTNQHAWGSFDWAAAEQRLCRAADDFLAQGPYYSTIWERDGRDWRSHHATPAAGYQALVDATKADGFRLVDVNGHRGDTGTTYASTWVRNTDGTPWAATHGQTFAAFTTRFDELSQAGYRMTKVSGWLDDGEPRYASVWTANPDKRSWISHIRMTGAEYQQHADEYDAKGYRLISVDGYELAGQARYAAVWLADPGTTGGAHTATPYRAIHGATAAAYQAWFDAAAADGFRLTDKDVYTVGPAVRWAAVATRDDGPPTRSFSTWNFYTYQPRWAQQKEAGYRPVTISAYR
ncbi:serine hydrolase [Actinoplanes sp. NPDC004185]